MNRRTATFMAGLLLAGSASAQAQSVPIDRDSIDRLTEADTNHDGRITRAEFLSQRATRFDGLDRNHDGVISKKDIGGLASFSSSIKRKFDQLLSFADANHDGMVTRAEFNAAPPLVFEWADKNHDGVVTATELAAAKASVR